MADDQEEVESPRVEKIVSTASLIPDCLSVLGRTADGTGHAYVKLDMKDRELTDLNGIEKYVHLRYIDVSDNKLMTVAPLSNLTYLLLLYAGNNQLTSVLEDVEPKKYLQVLDLSGNQIESITSVQHEALTKLNLNRNKIVSVSGLEQLQQLRVLELRGNSLNSTAGISAAVNLEELYLAENQLDEFTEMNLPKLKKLHVRQNKIRSLDGLQDLTSLEYLNIRDNEVEDLSQIAKLFANHYLTRLITHGNPVAETEEYRIEVAILLPRLISLDKEEFTQDEKEEAQALQQERAEEEAAAQEEQEADDQEDE